jgi:hypothetical protein
MRKADPIPQGWVQGWALVKGEPPNCECAGMYETRAEAEQAAETAGEGFHTCWGRYNEGTGEFASGTVSV